MLKAKVIRGTNSYRENHGEAECLLCLCGCLVLLETKVSQAEKWDHGECRRATSKENVMGERKTKPAGE